MLARRSGDKGSGWGRSVGCCLVEVPGTERHGHADQGREGASPALQLPGGLVCVSLGSLKGQEVKGWEGQGPSSVRRARADHGEPWGLWADSGFHSELVEEVEPRGGLKGAVT